MMSRHNHTLVRTEKKTVFKNSAGGKESPQSLGKEWLGWKK